MKTSWKDLGLLFLLVGMGMLVFGSLEYYIENEEDETGFTSIPQVIYRVFRKELCLFFTWKLTIKSLWYSAVLLMILF